jgi:serine/threonine-protein kinase
VLAYRDQPEKLPNIKYWQNKLEPLFKQAAENAAKQVIPNQNQKPNQNQPTTSETPTAKEQEDSDN